MRLTKNERGAAALELALFAPVIILLASIMVDASTYLMAIMKVDGASAEAARYVMNRSAGELDESAFRQAMLESFSSGKDDLSDIEISLTRTSSTKEPFTYPFYSGGDFKQLATEENYDSYLVSVTMTFEWPVFGRVLNFESGTFSVTARKYCEADNMKESTWSLT